VEKEERVDGELGKLPCAGGLPASVNSQLCRRILFSGAWALAIAEQEKNHRPPWVGPIA